MLLHSSLIAATKMQYQLRVAMLLACSLLLLADGASVGVNYGRVANNLPSPRDVVELIRKQGIAKVKLYDTDPTVLAAFAGSGVELIVALPNEQVHAAAVSKNGARDWVVVNVARHLPATKITAIAVGNEVLSSVSGNIKQLAPLLLPAMQNIHAALAELHLDGQIKISSPHSLATLSSSYPPSAGAFSSSIANSIMKPMLDFLSQTNSYVMINAYPFFAYESQPDVISLSYALFESDSGVKDPKTGLFYTNLFDAQLDAFFSAMASLGHPNLNIVVTETGWPSKGDKNEVGASPNNAAAYVSNLVKHITSNVGTPLRPGASIDTYIFALFNEDMKVGPTSERNYGLFYPDKRSVYRLDLTSALSPAVASRTPSTYEKKHNVGRKHHHHHHHLARINHNNNTRTQSSDVSWCVANPSISSAALQAALDYACGPGKADCSLIQPGQTCFNPNTLVAHASFAFNSFYQLNRKAPGTCSFGGASHLTQQDPSYNGCKYAGSV